MTSSATTPDAPRAAAASARQRNAARARRIDRAAALAFAGAAVVAVAVVAAVAVFVVREGWPSFAANGLDWFADAPSVTPDTQLTEAFRSGSEYLRAWPFLLGTLLTTGGAILIAIPFSLLAAIFVAELAPRPVVAILEPVIGLLAATPSVVFGLFAILVCAPWIDDALIDPDRTAEYAPVVTLTGANVLLGIIVLTVMIAPLMISIYADALRAVPTPWREGAAALGCDRWRVARRVSLAAIRPALVAGTTLAIGRALGEAIALSMATGSIAFTPNPADGWYFFLEPVRTLSATIVDYSEGFSAAELRADLFAFGAILFVSTAVLTLAAKLVSVPIERKLQGRA